MRKLALIFFLLFLSCTHNNNTADLIVDNIEKGTDSIRWRRYNKNKQVVETITSYNDAKIKTVIVYGSSLKPPERIHSYFIGKNYGHNFIFDPQGNLTYYSYYVGKGQFASYIRDYSLNGGSEVGTILVDEMKDDEGFCKLFFITAFHDKIQATISSTNGDSHNLYLTSSSFQPMLKESTINLANDSLYYIKTVATEKKTKLVKTYYDTLFITHMGKVLTVHLR